MNISQSAGRRAFLCFAALLVPLGLILTFGDAMSRPSIAAEQPEEPASDGGPSSQRDAGVAEA